MKLRYLLILLTFPASAETVLHCNGDWGSSANCGGCSGLRWENPAPTLKVKTTASDFWQTFSTLKPTDLVAVSSQPVGPATCAQVTGNKSIASFTEAPIPPTPTPTPSSDDQFRLTWTEPPFDTEGKPSVITGYHVRYTGPRSGEVILGRVTSYASPSLPNGTYSITVATMNGLEESVQSKVLSYVINVTAPIPPSTVITTEVLGLWILKRGTSNVQTGLASYPVCKALAESKATVTAIKYTCNVSNSVTVRK